MEYPQIELFATSIFKLWVILLLLFLLLILLLLFLLIFCSAFNHKSVSHCLRKKYLHCVTYENQLMRLGFVAFAKAIINSWMQS